MAGGAPAGDPANPTYSVAISDDQAGTNKKEFADNKDKKRLVPKVALSEASDTATSPTIGKTSSHDYIKSTQEDAAVLDSINPRKVAVTPVRKQTAGRRSLDSTRENEIEEVRGMLRRESTKGRRKASQNQMLAPSFANYQLNPNIPMIVESPPVPVGNQAQYFPAQNTAQSPVDYYGPPGVVYEEPTETSDGQQVEAPAANPQGVPGNAFSYQSQPQAGMRPQEQSSPSNVLSRRPVPGMTELKGALHHSTPSPSGR